VCEGLRQRLSKSGAAAIAATLDAQSNGGSIAATKLAISESRKARQPVPKQPRTQVQHVESGRAGPPPEVIGETMAKNDKQLFNVLRDSGMRKKVARYLSDPAQNGTTDRTQEIVDTVDKLRNAASELERRATKSRRINTAKKAARTRKRHAAKRSVAAKKAANTRASAKT
jgi:hypothetical protein